MTTYNFANIVAEKNCLITVGPNSYYADEYIIMPEGILLATINPKDETQIILTKIDNSGVVITEFDSGTTLDEFMELRDQMIEAMESMAEGDGCSCGEEGYNAVEDEDGECIENPDFKTEFDPEDINYR